MSVLNTIALYLRCSTDKQELFVQESLLNKFVQRYKEDNPQKEIIVQIYKDEGFSGSKMNNRPALMELLTRVKKGQINCLVITKLDRLARSLSDLLNIVNTLKEYQCDFIVSEDKLDTSNAQGRLLFQILGAFAEFERVIIFERMNAGRQKALLEGSKSGKPCHRPNAKIDEDGVIRKFELKMSMDAIAKSYNISVTPIRRILKSRGLIYGTANK